MFKKILVSSLVVILLTVVGAVVYQNTQASAGQDDAVVQGYRNGPGGDTEISVEYGNRAAGEPMQDKPAQPQAPIDGQPAGEHILPAPGELSQAEADGLLFMREEEKLARDVYTALFATWELPLFQNIANSEQSHMDAVKVLLDVYNLEDPALEQAGVFTNPELQTLYDQLVERGSQSLAEALQVGAAIEEIDILDLQTRLAQSDNLDIQEVYNNLLNGSENHLRSFANTLMTQTGLTYQPQYLSPEAYQAIIAQAGQGNRNGNRGQGGGGAGGRQGGKS